MGRYFSFVLLLSFWILGVITLHSAWAYVPTITSNGVPIRWKRPVKLNFIGNPTNHSGITPDEFFNAIITGLQRWKSAASGNIDFDYWQGVSSQSYPPTSDYKGLSTLYFASNSSSDTHLSSNVLGMTQVWYNTDSGEILEADIILNDNDFHFTNNPKDTSGYGSGASNFTDRKSNVYIQNVVTHELGHAVGLSHSGGLQSTMLFMESPEQAHLGCDELIAIHALYPSSDQSTRGGMTGTIISESGAPVFGAHVLAISQRRGTVLATSITDRSGKYLLTALEPGDYFLMAEPFYAGSQALPTYYSGLNSSICQNKTSFSRSFLTETNDFNLSKVAVHASDITPVPSLTVHCDSSGGAAIAENSNSADSLSAPGINPGESDGNSFGIVDRFNSSNINYYRLYGISGHIEIHAISYSLYSPVHPSVSLLAPNGSEIPTQISDPVYFGDSGYINHDSEIVTDELPSGDYILKISGNRLGANDYPAGPLSLDSVPFLVVTGSLNQGSPVLESLLPENARCRMKEDFSPYNSPSVLPPAHSSNQLENKGTGFCGTSKDTSSRENTGPGPGVIAGWLLPWLLMALFGRAVTYLHRNARPVNLR